TRSRHAACIARGRSNRIRTTSTRRHDRRLRIKSMAMDGDSAMRIEVEEEAVLIREKKSVCVVMLENGLTLELTYNEGSTYGVWLLGERLVWWVVAASA